MNTYTFLVNLCVGWADGKITAKEKNEHRAYDKAMDRVGKMLYVAVYDRPLTEKELNDYELDDLQKVEKEKVDRTTFEQMCDKLDETEREQFIWKAFR